MARPKQTLASHYGKLEVIAEKPGSRVLVRCLCGTEKTVHRSNLRAGRVTSCGAPQCRVPNERTSRLRGPSWIKRDRLRKLWDDYNSGAVAVNEVAEFYKVHPQTVYAVLHRMAKDGIDAYMAALGEDEEAPDGQEPLVPAPAPTRAGTVQPPPAVWIPKVKRA